MENQLNPIQAVEVAKEAAQKVKESRAKPHKLPTGGGDIFDTIDPNCSNTDNSKRKYFELDWDRDFASDNVDATSYADPIVIRDDPAFRQYLRHKRKPDEKDQMLIEYLEKYVGRIFYYYKNQHDLNNKVTSPITFFCNYVPFSPVRKYTIPSGVPVAIPRWIILYLRERCQNFQFNFEQKSREIIQSEKSRDPMGLALESNFVIRQGESLIKIMELPRAPKALVG